MTELARFRPAAAKLQPSFVFERASLALIATWRERLAAPGISAHSLSSEWRDPVACRLAL